jgi:hypothetical protein
MFILVVHALTTYLLTPRCRVLLEQLTGLQIVKKFPAFHNAKIKEINVILYLLY